MSLYYEQAKYERWWLHQKCRRAYSYGAFRLVTRVHVIGPPSGFNAIVELTYEGGETELISPPSDRGYKPAKSAVEIAPSPASSSPKGVRG